MVEKRELKHKTCLLRNDRGLLMCHCLLRYFIQFSKCMCSMNQDLNTELSFTCFSSEYCIIISSCSQIFSSSLMCSLTHKAFCFLCTCVQTYVPLQMTGDCREITAWSVVFRRCSCCGVGTGSFRLRCPAGNLPGAVEPVWIASQGLFLQVTPNKDFSNKVLAVTWCLSFEAATVYAGLNCYHFIRNWKLWTRCFFCVS